MVSLGIVENILAGIALFVAIVFGSFAFLFSFVSLSQSLDDTKRTSEQDNAMFNLAYQLITFYHLVLTIDGEGNYYDRIIVQQLADIKNDLSKCVNLRLYKEIRGKDSELFYTFLRIAFICDQKIQSRIEDFTFFNKIMEKFDERGQNQGEEGFINFCNNHVRYMICLLYTSPSPRDRTRSRMPSSA